MYEVTDPLAHATPLQIGFNRILLHSIERAKKELSNDIFFFRLGQKMTRLCVPNPRKTAIMRNWLSKLGLFISIVLFCFCSRPRKTMHNFAIELANALKFGI